MGDYIDYYRSGFWWAVLTQCNLRCEGTLLKQVLVLLHNVGDGPFTVMQKIIKDNKR